MDEIMKHVETVTQKDYISRMMDIPYLQTLESPHTKTFIPRFTFTKPATPDSDIKHYSTSSVMTDILSEHN